MNDEHPNLDVYELEQSIGFLAGAAYRKMTALFQSRLKAYGITPEQWSALYVIERSAGLIQREIAVRVGKDRPTTTRILDLLEKKSLIFKRTGKNDRRAFTVHATEAGRELVRQTLPIENRTNAEIRSLISEEDYETLKRALLKIKNSIAEINDHN